MAKKNILVIDDEKVVHLIFKTVLNQDYQLFFADNAQDGIDILSEHPIHLVLLDVNMPGISGIELLESIMIDTSLNRIPVIIVTAHVSEEYEKKTKQFGAVEFLEKTHLFSEKENILKLVEKHCFLNQSPFSASRPEQITISCFERFGTSGPCIGWRPITGPECAEIIA